MSLTSPIRHFIRLARSARARSTFSSPTARATCRWPAQSHFETANGDLRVHAAEHVVALVFSDVAKIPAVRKLIRRQQRLYRHFTAVRAASSMLEKKPKSFNNGGTALGPDRAAGSRMASYFYGFHEDLRLNESFRAGLRDGSGIHQHEARSRRIRRSSHAP